MNRPLKALLLPLTGALLLLGGIWLGGHPETLPGFARDAFVSDDRALRAELIDRVKDGYYRPVKESALRDSSLKGLVEGLNNPFSAYLTPSETREFKKQLTGGQFAGIGVEVAEDRRGLRVSSVFGGSPAKRAGLRVGLVIVRVNGRSIARLSSRVSTARIRGRPGTPVRLTVFDPTSERARTVSVKRAKVSTPLVTGRLERAGGAVVGVVRLRSFGQDSHGLIAAEVGRLRKRGAKGVVLDLRGNGGGLLDEAVNVAGLFVPSGRIVSTRGRTSPERKFDAPGGAPFPKLPLTVLVDRGSASASEIVSGALRDRHRATVVGTRTFGKGVFQSVTTLSNGGTLELVAGRYYLPGGEGITQRGLHPRVPARDDARTPRDEALPVALRVLRREIH